ncbi:Rid family hydrolase [Sphingomonas oryzagri]|uniref:Rid family hydrolase n=1 Tax=Sphingomonas oryzagri TaxID=3042314 RepID=A0ABT6N411_9SPHN|nr:Rid family hydrolase [Sphingomonas oryzagri]MDH7640019.1 Rid family hydrolase [Sphingomonas oryzagri]
MSLERYSSGTRFEEIAAYSRAVADDLYIHVSGTVGGDPQTGAMPDAVEDQLANIFATIERALAHFGAGFADVTRSRVFIVSADVLMPVAAALKARFGDCPPTNTTLIVGIPAPGAKVEIEVTARRPG